MRLNGCLERCTGLLPSSLSKVHLFDVGRKCVLGADHAPIKYGCFVNHHPISLVEVIGTKAPFTI
jgi:hypothetical protein